MEGCAQRRRYAEEVKEEEEEGEDEGEKGDEGPEPRGEGAGPGERRRSGAGVRGERPHGHGDAWRAEGGSGLRRADGGFYRCVASNHGRHRCRWCAHIAMGRSTGN